MECLTLKKSNCKNCYKCIRHCPVKSIRFTGNQAYIIGDECIMCGQCFVVCPQNAKQITDETEKVKVFLQSGVPVVVSLAPSFVANFDGVGIESMREALKQLGFYDVEETAIGATIVKREYDRICNEEGRDIIITSCCHSVNLLIQKHFPKLIPYLADVLSPMQAHCKEIKKRIPNAKTVFIGPCVAKKDEAQRYEGLVDAVLTFDELSAWLKSKNIVPEKKLDHESGIHVHGDRRYEKLHHDFEGNRRGECPPRLHRNVRLHRQLYRRTGHGEVPRGTGQRLCSRREVCGQEGFHRCAA